MRVHTQEKIDQLKSLRAQGKSINELVAILDLPKTTIWHHIQGVALSAEDKAILRSRQGGSTKRRSESVIKASEIAVAMLSGPLREQSIALAMLYWAEGTKSSCVFTNTDARMIRVFLRSMNQLFQIADQDLDFTLRIFTGTDRATALQYWSGQTRVASSQFRIYLNDGGQKGRAAHGICRVTVKKGGFTLKIILALIEQLSQQY